GEVLWGRADSFHIFLSLLFTFFFHRFHSLKPSISEVWLLQARFFSHMCLCCHATGCLSLGPCLKAGIRRQPGYPRVPSGGLRASQDKQIVKEGG
ncbi:Uncharacterized protein DAT39_004563, partial [Clarias magur]